MGDHTIGAGLFDMRSLTTPALREIRVALAATFGEPEDRLYALIGRLLRERGVTV